MTVLFPQMPKTDYERHLLQYALRMCIVSVRTLMRAYLQIGKIMRELREYSWEVKAVVKKYYL